MTLNIVLLGKDQIHLGADMRLTDPIDHRVLTDASPKIFTIQEWGWQGIVTYCGIGRWGNKHTSEWIKGWANNERTDDLSFDQLVSMIHRKGGAWLRDIARSSGYRGGHSFIVAGVVRGEAKLALLSNYDTLRGRRSAPRPDLGLEYWGGVRCFAFGASTAVLHGEMNALRSRLTSGHDAAQIQLAIARTIARASQRSLASGTVSSNCYTYSVLPQGNTQGRLNGKSDTPVSFPSLNVGADIMSLFRQLWGSGFNAIPVGGASFDAAAPNLPQKCSPSLEPNLVATSYAMEELPHLGSGHARPTSINERGTVLGYSGHTVNGALVGCVWDNSGGVTQLTFGTGATWAMSINDHNEVAGTLTMADGGNRAFRWSNGILEVSDTLGGFHANAHSINNSGTIVGSSWTLPGNTPGDKAEAFFWPRNDKLRLIGAPIRDWNSRATSIGDNGTVVGIGLSRTFTGPSPVAFLWNIERGMMPIVVNGKHAPPISAIDRAGNNFLLRIMEQGNSIVLLFRNGKPIISLAIPDHANIAALNGAGQVVYNKETTEGLRSYVWTNGNEVKLPCYKNHQSEAVSINGSGVVVGHVWQAGHGHAVKWIPLGSSAHQP